MTNERLKAFKKWLIEIDASQSSIARELKISQSSVWNIMAGRMKSERITSYLRKIGCPKDILDKVA